MKVTLTSHPHGNTSGFSVIELLIVVAMISVISGFALIQIVQARQDMTRANAAQQLATYLEKARVDSLRRHATDSTQMAQVTIVNASFYTVAIDADGSGALDAPLVVSLPANSGLQFTGLFPRTIYFNWRGNSVTAAGVSATPSYIDISNGYGASRIHLTAAGQPSFQEAPPVSPVTNSAAPAPTYRRNTQQLQ
jgi:prepilin-type N-terminal cleavage/methylation domain-containing protein